MGGSLQVGWCHLQFRLFECHDLVASYVLITRGHTRVLGHDLCPWCTATKPTSCDIIVVNYLRADDTIHVDAR